MLQVIFTVIILKIAMMAFIIIQLLVELLMTVTTLWLCKLLLTQRQIGYMRILIHRVISPCVTIALLMEVGVILVYFARILDPILP